MKLDHIHFFVEDAVAQRDWFVQRMGWRSLGASLPNPGFPNTHTERLQLGGLDFLVSSPLDEAGPVAQYLHRYAPGVADVAVQVMAAQATKVSALGSGQIAPGDFASVGTGWATVQGWGSIRHTLVETGALGALEGSSFCDHHWPLELGPPNPQTMAHPHSPKIDHLVLNVPKGELDAAVQFYQNLFDLQLQQSFRIQTDHSGLHSQVLYSPQHQCYFNVNEPASASSQIQTFLDANRGAGIQHLALACGPIVPTIAALRSRGLPLLAIASVYYQQLQARWQARQERATPLPVPGPEWQQLQAQQILVDWQPDQPGPLLLQTFSLPIFEQPTFFLSLLNGGKPLAALGKAIFWHCIKRWKRSWIDDAKETLRRLSWNLACFEASELKLCLRSQPSPMSSSNAKATG
ncbi:MAG: 4-hydroxyphenylpyruvate dioxygenase [Synechococcales cyanobacterium RU_4_20]|nr:4-hydroxyphenylpyruvate dioxygenase [Synechococcales cyanobacterium RU_4_20]NJR70144.1 4-hydroxyphenylpyruvate dioxygenase [Synechococcales cyanobacterium CRU_2_2]